MKKLGTRIVVAVLISIAAPVAVWILTYPSASDPKNIRYVLWKHGLYRMDIDTASGIMIGDANSEMLVLGKTKVELREKFGYLSTLPVASPYLRGCYESSDWNGKDVLFIRNSPWMIVFSGDKATQLVLIKGC
jgi:hypothetical protein